MQWNNVKVHAKPSLHVDELICVNNDQRQRACLFSLFLFNDLRLFFYLISRSELKCFNIYRKVTLPIFEWLFWQSISSVTHLTKSTKIPPTKITRPISGTMLEMLDAVKTTEFMTFILLLCSSFHFKFSSFLIAFISLSLSFIKLLSLFTLLCSAGQVNPTEPASQLKRSLVVSIVKCEMSRVEWCRASRARKTKILETITRDRERRRVEWEVVCQVVHFLHLTGLL